MPFFIYIYISGELMVTRTKRASKQTTPKLNSKRNPVSIEIRDMTDITPYSQNPRDNEQAVESVKKSIESFGFLVPIVVDEAGVIVAGHTRYEAAIRMGLTDAPCIVASHLTVDQINAFRLIDNKVSELSKWDTDMLASELTALENSGISFTEFGWSQEEIDCLTEVVAEDCMSAGVAAGLDQATSTGRADQRAPNRTRLVIGEFVLFVPTEVYRRWANEVRVDCDYVESEIEILLKQKLGIDLYEQE